MQVELIVLEPSHWGVFEVKITVYGDQHPFFFMGDELKLQHVQTNDLFF